MHATVRTRWAAALLVAGRLAAAPLAVSDLEGRSVDVLEGGDERAAVVLVFAGTDCPISNRYAPELARLHAEYAPRNMAFYLVYPDPALSSEAAARHVADYGIAFPALLDREHRLVEHTGVEMTPEAAVLARDGRVLYRGRIDDRWVAFGRRRPRATRHDLRDALEAILRGESPPEPGGRAVGCYITPLEAAE